MSPRISAVPARQPIRPSRRRTYRNRHCFGDLKVYRTIFRTPRESFLSSEPTLIEFAATYSLVYIRGASVKTAKVFRSGNSQAVRIPKEFHLEDEEVEIRREGRGLVLEPRKRSWTALFDSLDKFTDDFMAEGRRQPPLQRRRRAL